MSETFVTDRSKMSPTERKLRHMLALRAGNPGIYTDDGELSDATEHPFIDFLRDDVEVIEAKLIVRAQNRLQKQYAGEECVIDYTDHDKTRRLRRIRPYHLFYGSTHWEKEEQWLLCAVDLEDKDHSTAIKPFHLKDVHMMTGTLSWILQSSIVYDYEKDKL